MNLFDKVHFQKIPDQPGYNPKTETRFIPKRPYDCYGWIPGNRPFAIETKMCKTISMPIAKVTEDQEENLLDAVNARGHAWIIINFRRKTKGGRINRAVVVPIELWIDLKNNHPRKSVRLEDLLFYLELKRVKLSNGKYGWDVTKLFRE